MLESLDGGTPETAPLGEIEVLGGGHEFYDFEAKYLDEEHLRLTCPADLPDVGGRARSPSWPCGRSRPSAARAWPGSTSS